MTLMLFGFSERKLILPKTLAICQLSVKDVSQDAAAARFMAEINTAVAIMCQIVLTHRKVFNYNIQTELHL